MQWRGRIKLTGFFSGRDPADAVLARLEPHLIVESGVWGTHCTGHRIRIDAVLRPRDASHWASGVDTRIEVEFNCPAGLLREPGLHARTKCVAQTIDYEHVDWSGYGRMQVFTYSGAIEWLSRRPADPESASPMPPETDWPHLGTRDRLVPNGLLP